MATPALLRGRVAACGLAAVLMAALPARPVLAGVTPTASPSPSSSYSPPGTPLAAKPSVSYRVASAARPGKPFDVRIAITQVGAAGAKVSFSSDQPLKLSAAKPRRLPPGDSSLTLRASARSPGLHFLYVSVQHEGGGSLTPIAVDVQNREPKASSAKASKASKAPETDAVKKSTGAQAKADAAKKKKKKKKKKDGGSATGTRSHQ